MFTSPRFKVLHLGRRGLGAATAAMLAVILMLPGISGALTSGEEHAGDSFTIGEIADRIGATALYDAGVTGEGVTVAVIDTGVADVPGLDGEGKLYHGPDLSFEAGIPELYNRDSFGHGTAMASIIAGNDGVEGGFRGIAPDATILSMKVADNSGSVDVTQVIAAIDFVIETKDDTGVRVINLAYRTDGGQDPATDPLIAAVERAWDAGIVVVVSAGNDGGKSLGNPALSPYVVAVAASSELSTQTTDFSNGGDKERTPDITAPGERVLALASPGSRLAEEYPSAFIDDRFMRGSGTSQAAAVVSGAAALLIDQDPSMTPDEVKAALMLGADASSAGGDWTLNNSQQSSYGPHWSDDWTGSQIGSLKLSKSNGAGYLNVSRSAGLDVAGFDQPHAKSDGTGSLDDARGTVIATFPDGTEITGDTDFTGSTWSGSTWSGSTWSGSTWSGSTWSGSTWSSSSWSGSTWSGSTWSGSTWSGSSWSSSSWSSSSWSSSSWSGSTWSGSTWSGSSWSGSSWSGSSWSGSSWSGVSWSSLSWSSVSWN